MIGNPKLKLLLLSCALLFLLSCKKKVSPDRCHKKNKDVVIKIINQTDNNIGVLSTVRHCNIELTAYYEQFKNMGRNEIIEYASNGEYYEFRMLEPNNNMHLSVEIIEEFQFITVLISYDGANYKIEFL